VICSRQGAEVLGISRISSFISVDFYTLNTSLMTLLIQRYTGINFIGMWKSIKDMKLTTLSIQNYFIRNRF